MASFIGAISQKLTTSVLWLNTQGLYIATGRWRRVRGEAEKGARRLWLRGAQWRWCRG